MACLQLRNTITDQIREVEVQLGVSVATSKDEVVHGVKGNCGPTIMAPATDLRTELDEAIGHGAGDWLQTMISPLAKLIGKTKCSKCEARRIATNAYGKLKAKHGQFKAMVLMKELWQLSTVNSDQVLEKLQGYLND